ncbi:sigma-70 family RNA polymerase sigma factor [Acetobacteraceae bacterium KSS8]|uniref:Sigma-70 family RNA polymerase sigma factor n=1 Tax=Endosaccharibacter trunci TaxID=2812733 RepID=A0ABT1W539_9PROT|nr:sigma-70 family RNA polymerase sigma factor [Acetobacteraceae bacterium KSS8]
MPAGDDPASRFIPHRADLLGLAYRMTGSLATAEDIVQDAFLRWQAADRTEVAQPRAWLLKAVARLSIDHIRSARNRHEVYVGPWLPEPLITAGESPQETAFAQTQRVSVAVLLTLQRLTPAERAVFILHDLFDTPFAELATLLGRTEAACRKLASRARAHLTDAETRHPVADGDGERIARAFHAASRDGDGEALRALLAEAAVLRTDGGGVRPSALNPIGGADRIARFFAGIARKRSRTPILLHLGRINGLPGFVTLEPDGLPQTTALEIREERISAIYIVRNPDKLGRVGVQLAALGKSAPAAGPVQIASATF